MVKIKHDGLRYLVESPPEECEHERKYSIMTKAKYDPVTDYHSEVSRLEVKVCTKCMKVENNTL